MKRVLVVAAPLLAACVHSTPVAPAPISPEEAPKLAAALSGTCELTSEQEPGGTAKAISGIHLTFKPDGKLHYTIESGMGTVQSDVSYHLDGRNIVSDGMYRTMRVDEWSDEKLTIFVYDTSKIHQCTRKRTA